MFRDTGRMVASHWKRAIATWISAKGAQYVLRPWVVSSLCRDLFANADNGMVSCGGVSSGLLGFYRLGLKETWITSADLHAQGSWLPE